MAPIPPLQKLLDTIGDGIGQSNFGPELQQRLRQILQSLLEEMNLVTREEFDAQTKVLQHTRAKVEELEKQLEALTVQLDSVAKK